MGASGETRFARAAIALADALLAGRDPLEPRLALMRARQEILAGVHQDPRAVLELARVYDGERHRRYSCYRGGRARRPVIDPEGRRFESRAEAAAAWGLTAQGVGKMAAYGTHGWRDA